MAQVMAQVFLRGYRRRKRLGKVKKALLDEGFKDTRLQIRRKNQVFGLTKKLTAPWEIHIRGFVDGSLASEIEISREYLEHLNNNYRVGAIQELVDILEKYKIRYKLHGEKPQKVQLEEMEVPKTLTQWEPIFETEGLLRLLWVVSDYIRN